MVKNAKAQVKAPAKAPAKAQVKAPKKRSTKLREKVPAEYVFYCQNGSTFSDIDELVAGLLNMTDEIYTYHSNMEKHDFSNWIRDVIRDEELADELVRAVSRLEAAEHISARLNEMYS